MEHMQPLVVMDNISLNLGHVLGCGRTGVVVEGTFEGQSVAIKILDIVKNPNLLSEMENELLIYQTLSDLQGQVIPKIKCYGDLWGMFRMIIMEPIGKFASYPWSDDIKKKVIWCYKMLHKHHVLHNDVKDENILVNEKGNAMIIDLALSRMDATSNKLNREMHEVKRLLGCER